VPGKRGGRPEHARQRRDLCPGGRHSHRAPMPRSGLYAHRRGAAAHTRASLGVGERLCCETSGPYAWGCAVCVLCGLAPIPLAVGRLLWRVVGTRPE